MVRVCVFCCTIFHSATDQESERTQPPRRRLCPRVFLGCREQPGFLRPGGRARVSQPVNQPTNQPTRQPANQSTRCPLALLWLAPPPWELELANHRQPVGSVTPADDMEPAQRGKVSANLAAILHPCPPQPAALSPTETLTPNNRPKTKLETRWLLANPWRAPDAVTRGS